MTMLFNLFSVTVDINLYILLFYLYVICWSISNYLCGY